VAEIGGLAIAGEYLREVNKGGKFHRPGNPGTSIPRVFVAATGPFTLGAG
jgi:hypothetical protein